MKPIDALSLGWRTHLIFARFDAEVIERPDHLLVRTPHNPTYWWGNHLLCDRPPRAGEAQAWLAAFAEGIGSRDMGLETLVIVADPADVAIGLYESLGFVRGVSTWCLARRPTVAV